MRIYKVLTTCIILCISHTIYAADCIADRHSVLEISFPFTIGDTVKEFEKDKWVCTSIDDAGYGHCHLKNNSTTKYTIAANSGVDFSKGGDIVEIKAENFPIKSIMGVSQRDDLKTSILKLIRYTNSLIISKNNEGQLVLGGGDCLIKIVHEGKKNQNQTSWLWGFTLDDKMRLKGIEITSNLPLI